MATRIAAGGAAAALVLGSTLMLGAAAHAVSSGAADSAGAGAQFDIRIDGLIDFHPENAQLGLIEVEGIGQQTHADVDVTVVDEPLATLTVGESASASEVTEQTARASATTSDVTSTLLGTPFITVDSASAEAECPVVGEPQAEVEVAGLHVLGSAEEIPLDADNPVYEASVSLGDEVLVQEEPAVYADLSTLTVTVAVTRLVTEVEGLVVGISLFAAAELNGSYGAQTFTDQPIGGIILATVGCGQVEAPLLGLSIDPPTGPVEGGQTVTILGTGLTADTTVSFGDSPATDVVVDPSGLSLTAVSPAGPAGHTLVTLTMPDGMTATIDYDYVAAVAPIEPVLPAGNGGAARLADTGSGPAQALGVAGAALALGAASLLLLHGGLRRSTRRAN